jgi:integrase
MVARRWAQRAEDMLRTRLTKHAVDALQAREEEVRIWDTTVSGFGIRCRTGGSKFYFLKYRLPSGRQGWATIGRHGSPWTVETARREARRLLGQIVDGEDPLEAKAVEKRDITLSQLCDLYLGQPMVITNRGTAKKASSLEIDRSNIERHIKPLLGQVRLRALTRGDVERFQQDVASGKSKADIKTKPRGRAIVSGGKGTAARSVAILSMLLSFAVIRGLRVDNPARGVRLLSSQRRERFLSFAEITRIGEALSKLETKGSNPTAIRAIRMLLLTGCRRGEIIGLQWKWVDFERRCLCLPDSKTGAKTVPLGDPAIDLLRTMPAIGGSEFVFPASRGDGHIIGLRSVWEEARILGNLPGVRIHDLRHSFASVAVSGGESLYIVGKILGHRQARTTEVYAHLAPDPVQAAADRAARKIAEALSGEPSPPADADRTANHGNSAEMLRQRAEN